MNSRNLLQRVNRSLTLKLVIAISLFMFIGSAVIWLSAILNQRQALMEEAISRLASFADLTQKSIHHDMLDGDMFEIQEIIESLGTTEAITAVRLLNASGVIRHSSKYEEIGKQADANQLACGACHQKVKLDSHSPLHARKWVVRYDQEQRKLLTMIDTIEREPSCSAAACHVHTEKDKILGYLVSDFSLDPLTEKTKKQVTVISAYVLFVVSMIAVVLSFILWKLVLRPLSGLSEGMKQVSSGNLASTIEIGSSDEIGRLGDTFNEMTGELSIARHRMEQWTQTLEVEVEKKTHEIRETQDKLIQAEKMAALGRMTADIAHEIRNPLTALGGFGRRLEKEATSSKQRQYASLIVEESDRLEHILKDVLTFSWEHRFHFEKGPLTEIVASSVKFFSDLCAEHGILLKENYRSNLPVLLEKDHVRQAVLNLIANSLDAMEKGGTLSVSVEEEKENDIVYVAVHISDTGMGIDNEKLDQVFEPFYTTKKIGKGTGLGLAICRKIVTEHGGFIRLKNLEGGGLRASLYFPYQEEEQPGTIPCWEFMQCGRDKDNSVKCPAYPHFGKVCWAVAGTLCAGKIQGTFAQKYEDCRKCAFFCAMHGGKEGEK